MTEYPQFVEELRSRVGDDTLDLKRIRGYLTVTAKNRSGLEEPVLTLAGPMGEPREPGEWVIFQVQRMDQGRKRRRLKESMHIAREHREAELKRRNAYKDRVDEVTREEVMPAVKHYTKERISAPAPKVPEKVQ